MTSSNFAKVASDVAKIIRRHASADSDAEWQRVNSYIADVLKDAHVLYAKMARLQGDFGGEELDRLRKISEAVLALGDELSGFAKAFKDGQYSMVETEFTYGGQSQAPTPNRGTPPSSNLDDAMSNLGGSEIEPVEVQEADEEGAESDSEEDESNEEDKED